VVILLRIFFRGEGISVHAVDNLLALLMALSPLSKLHQVFRLDLEQAALDGGGAPQPPQQLASLSTSSLSTADCAS
jgi:hypothetical protein